MQKKWKATKLHDDPFASCGKCSWETLSGVPFSDDGGNDYGCTECGMIWRQHTHGILTDASGRTINMPLDADGDVIEDPFDESELQGD